MSDDEDCPFSGTPQKKKKIEATVRQFGFPIAPLKSGQNRNFEIFQLYISRISRCGCIGSFDLPKTPKKARKIQKGAL